jgi:hypothetical protein
MSKPFDATLNALIDLRASQWADCFASVAGMPVGPSEPINTNLSSSLQADRVFRIDSKEPYLLHLELEASPRLGIPAELHRYNTLIDHRHDLPVETVLILLRPKAEAAFSLVTDESSRDLEGNLVRFRERVKEAGIDETTAKTLISSSYFLCGLRYDWDMVTEMYRRLDLRLEDSTTYQHVLERGESKGSGSCCCAKAPKTSARPILRPQPPYKQSPTRRDSNDWGSPFWMSARGTSCWRVSDYLRTRPTREDLTKSPDRGKPHNSQNSTKVAGFVIDCPTAFVKIAR